MRWKYASRRRSSLGAGDPERARRQSRHRHHHRQGQGRRGHHRPPVPAGELAGAVPARRRTCLHGLVVQVPQHVRREVVGGLVASVAVLLEGLHHDPVQLAAHQPRQPGRLGLALGRDRRQGVPRVAQPRARPGRLLLPDQAEDLGERGLLDPLAAQRRAAREQLVQEHAQRVDVAAGVDAQGAHLRLLRAHVFQRADQGAVLREQRPLGQLLLGRLGHAEVDHLGHRLAVVERDHDVGRLDVAVDDPLLVGVLDRLADRHEQLQPLPRRQVVVVAVLGDRHAVDQLHDEVGPAPRGGPGVEDAGDVDMIHHCQGLPLGLEAGDDLPAVHPRLDDLERDPAPYRLGLLGHVDRAHAALADPLEEFVGPDHGACRFE